MDLASEHSFFFHYHLVTIGFKEFKLDFKNFIEFRSDKIFHIFSQDNSRINGVFWSFEWNRSIFFKFEENTIFSHTFWMVPMVENCPFGWTAMRANTLHALKNLLYINDNEYFMSISTWHVFQIILWWTEMCRKRGQHTIIK